MTAMDTMIDPQLRALLLGGQKSGKSRCAEKLAAQWLAQQPGHEALLLATATAWDDEMRDRIARHQRDRAARVPGMATIEEPRDVATMLAAHSTPQRLLVVDCITLWLTNWLMPAVQTSGKNMPQAQEWQEQIALFLVAIERAPGPVVLVSNEIGLGVIPLGAQVRAFVDALGALNQRLATVCNQVTLMAAGLPLQLK